jgi:hypothetical protein
MNRFDRITAILLQLQARRVVSLRTIYRDLRTLELAGVPLYGEAGVGYALAEGYRLPPVLFTHEEATALLTAEKLAARLTDAPTALLTSTAMNKLRAVLRPPDRDHLAALTPHIQVLGPAGWPSHPNWPSDRPRAKSALLKSCISPLSNSSPRSFAAAPARASPPNCPALARPVIRLAGQTAPRCRPARS